MASSYFVTLTYLRVQHACLCPLRTQVIKKHLFHSTGIARSAQDTGACPSSAVHFLAHSQRDCSHSCPAPLPPAQIVKANSWLRNRQCEALNLLSSFTLNLHNTRESQAKSGYL